MLDLSRTLTALQAAGLPVQSVSSPDGVAIVVQWNEGVTPSPAQQAQANAIIVNPLYGARRQRLIHDIFVDVMALTGTQKNAIWADLNAGDPHRYMTSAGDNDGDLAVMFWIMTYSGITAPAAIQPAQALVISLYTQDNPAYLRNPPFAPTVNISGDQPVEA